MMRADGTAPAAGDKSKQAAAAILRAIRMGELSPGQPLPEAELTLRYGISRGSLREALRQLSVQGLVVLSRFRGASVATLDHRAALDLLDVMDPLVQVAAHRAAERCDTEAARSRIAAAANAAQATASGPDRAYYLECRRFFYEAIVELAGNAELARQLPLARADLFRTQVEVLRQNAQHRRYALGYVRIADAIGNRDPQAARKAIAAHFRDMREIVEQLRETAEDGGR